MTVKPIRLVNEVPDDYEVTPGEIDNIVYLTCRYTVGWPYRAVDLAIIQLMTPPGRGTEYINRLVINTCEYLWDHVCGEPDEFSSEDLVRHIIPLLHEWYTSTTPNLRQDTRGSGPG
jgi:hypothetical protein